MYATACILGCNYPKHLIIPLIRLSLTKYPDIFSFDKRHEIKKKAIWV